MSNFLKFHSIPGLIFLAISCFFFRDFPPFLEMFVLFSEFSGFSQFSCFIFWNFLLLSKFWILYKKLFLPIHPNPRLSQQTKGWGEVVERDWAVGRGSTQSSFGLFSLGKFPSLAEQVYSRRGGGNSIPLWIVSYVDTFSRPAKQDLWK